ncbi:MAG: hypothetical protein CSA75_00970 [Sorangium cellulosum]|nr:MAG: hypothetical protein CSA75_00970 [Sorangium cellulosum]
MDRCFTTVVKSAPHVAQTKAWRGMRERMQPTSGLTCITVLNEIRRIQSLGTPRSNALVPSNGPVLRI